MPQAENLVRESATLAPGIEIRLPDQNGTDRRLSDFAGRLIVLFFYPKDETPGCTVEGKEFRDNFEAFEEAGAVIIGVSVDSVESHRAFAARHALPFMILSDQHGELARAFGVMHDGAADRSTFIIGPELYIRRVFHDVNPRGHARELLMFIKSFAEAHRMLGG